MAEPVSRDDLVKRLKRIEGQVRGIQRMVEEERECGDILGQLSAVNEGIRRVSALLAERYALECLDEGEEGNKSRETIAALIETLMKAPR